MTKEEAINILSWMPENFNMLGAGCVGEREAIKMAIEALKTVDVVTIQTGQTYGKSAYIGGDESVGA